MTHLVPPGGRPTREKPAMSILDAARAEALFASDLPVNTYDHATLEAAIRAAIRTHHGSRGCAAVLAGEYGDHPETAVARMRWCVEAVAAVYPHRELAVAA